MNIAYATIQNRPLDFLRSFNGKTSALNMVNRVQVKPWDESEMRHITVDFSNEFDSISGPWDHPAMARFYWIWYTEKLVTGLVFAKPTTF